ncbi:CapA family protein [Paenibacillus sp. sptzw28]|uniref:CapA family protein n=1 Tax=Paenibacillus sp. sptzw28 TaxID=715179 RepID=UPI001C6E19B4|nr:CapA family protein [Paenibacillus sp. sptzw28]QYR20378.1 CapA family protein [Paenibacillus sp. sptzw28]
MYVSRSESRQHNKKRKSRRIRRLLFFNLAMLIIICVLAAVYFSMRQSGDGRADPGSGDANRQIAGNTSPGTGESGASAGKGRNNSGSEGSGNGASAGSDPAASGAGSGGSGVPEGQAPGGSAVKTSHDGREESGGNGGKVTLSFVGDILLASSVENLMEKNGYDYPYKKSLPFLTKPDIMAGNLETPITERGLPAANKSYVFKGSPKSLPALKNAGFDIVNLANNHTLDQGVDGLLDTIGHLDEAGISNMGAGNDDAEAFKPAVLESNGVSVAYIGLTRVVPVASWKADKNRPGLAETYDSTRALKAIREAKKLANIVVVMVHWGIEKSDTPNADQKRLAHEYIDAGADLVIGSHPHVLQGFEMYKGKWISYSLGNYIFNVTKTDKTKDTGVLDAVCTGEGSCSLQFHPMRAALSQPAPLQGEQAAALLHRLSGLSINATIDEDGYIKPKEQ